MPHAFLTTYSSANFSAETAFMNRGAARPTVTRALELGDTDGETVWCKGYHGDWFLNNAARRRPHDGVLRAWYDFASPSPGPLWEMLKPKQSNEGFLQDRPG